MPPLEDVRNWSGLDLYGEHGDKIGEVTEIYLDETTGEPEWLAVRTGLLGMSSNLVPIARAVRHDDRVEVPYTKDAVKDAPDVDAEDRLSYEDERLLYDHYAMPYEEPEYHREQPVGDHVSDPTTDSAMTRSEEEMVVGTAKEETGRARLRKYVVTDDVETTVPVSREEVRVEREPITDGNVGEAKDGTPFREEEHEVTLHAEEPVVEKRTVPKERVRIDKDTQVEEETVSGEVRKEQIEADTPRG